MDKMATLKAARKAALERSRTTQAALSTDKSPAAFAARWEASESYRAASRACREYRKSLSGQE
jgi:hypothetical protein